jgi:hypothetical protein
MALADGFRSVVVGGKTCQITPGIEWRPDDDLLDRVKRAYRLASEMSHPPGPIWRRIDARRRPIHEALISRDNGLLRAILADPAATDLFYGIDNIFADFVDHLERQEEDHAAEWARSLCQFFGATDFSFDALDTALSQRVDFPNPFRGEIGYATARGLASGRALWAIYQTARLRQIIDGRRNVLEIGPGMARVGYYAGRAGLRYTTVDLPLGIVAQACFLAATLGPDAIWLPGDDPADADDKIRLLSPAMLRDRDEQFDVILNADSYVELGWPEALRYGFWLKRHARFFLSINHIQLRRLRTNWVARICRWPSACLERPNPLWSNYIEALYSFADQ